MKINAILPLILRVKFPVLLAGSFLIFGAVGARAETSLAAWDVNGVTAYGASPLAPTTSASGVTAEGLTRGAGVTTSGSGASNAWGGTGWDGNTTAAAAITANDYVTFSISANAGSSVSFTSIPAYNIRRSTSGPSSGQWQYKVGSGPFIDIGSEITWGSVITAAGNLQSAISLSGISDLQNVPAGTTVVFRIVNYNASSSAGVWYINNLSVAGPDLEILGTVSSTAPTISTTGTPAAQTTSVGVASSPPAQFSVSGVNLTAGITVTPPAGFEVSTSSSSGYSPTSILVGAAGTVAPTTVYIRLAAATAVGTYSGDITLTSPTATTVTVPMPSSTVSATAVPVIGTTGTPSALNATYGSASASTSFQISGTDMNEGVLVTPSSGFEVSSDDSTFQSSVTVGGAGAFGPANLYVRLKSGQPAGPVTGGTLTLSSSGANNVVVDIPASTVAQKELTVTGVATPVKTYDGGTGFSPVTGGTLSGVVGTDDVVLGGTPVGTFATSGVADGIEVTISGYTLSGTAAANYTLAQPGPVLGNIQPATITITAHNVSKIPGDVLTGGAGSSDFAVTGLAPGDTVGTVTITYGAAALAGATAGTYAGQVTPSDATGGTYNPANYNALVYNPGSIFVNAPFTAGNIVVEQIGDGAASLSGSAFPVSVLEFTSAGTLAQTVALPTSGSFRLTDSGTSTSNGFLNSNGDYLAVPGYNTAPGTTGVASLNTKVTHILGLSTGVETRIEYPTTGTIPFSGSNLRSVVPTGDSTFYATGAGTGGVWYYDGTAFVRVHSTNSNTRNIEICNGKLYFSTGSGTTGIYQVGTGLPTAASTSATLVLATPSPYGFAFSPDGNTLYVADDRSVASGGGIQKWTYSGSAWSLAYTLGTGSGGVSGARGLAVDFSGANPVIYATTAESSLNRLITVTDTGAGSTVTTLSTAPANTIYRGVDFSPGGGTAPEIQLYSNDLSANVANAATVNIGNQPLSVQNFSFALKNTGTASLTLGTVGVTASTNATVNFTAQPSASVAAAGSGTLTFDVTPTAAGDWSVTLSVATNDSDENPTTWTVSGTARTPFQSWADALNWSGGDSSPGGDPNHDGITNLEAYAFDIDPVAASGSGKRAKLLAGTDTVTAGGPWFTTTYRRSTSATGVNIAIQATNDLATPPADLTIDGVNVIQEVANADIDGDGSAELIRLRVKIPAGAGKRFFSLRVSEP